jgi:hypothetical protein
MASFFDLTYAYMSKARTIEIAVMLGLSRGDEQDLKFKTFHRRSLSGDEGPSEVWRRKLVYLGIQIDTVGVTRRTTEKGFGW